MVDMEQQHKERRRYPRAPIGVIVRVESDDGGRHYYSKNLSSGGTFLLAEDPLDEETEVEMELFLPLVSAPVRAKGEVVIKQDEIREIESGSRKMDSSLAEAADKAHRLAKALRMKGYQAYEFHNRRASIVTVGSFNSVGTPRPDGQIEINPQIHRIMKTFGAEPTALPGQTTPVTPLKSLVGIPFDILPIPVQVPKRSISAALRSRG